MPETPTTVAAQPHLEELLWVTAGSDFSGIRAEHIDAAAHEPEIRAALFSRAVHAVAFAQQVEIAGDLSEHIRHRKVVEALRDGRLPSAAISSDRSSSERVTDLDLTLATGRYLCLAAAHPESPFTDPITEATQPELIEAASGPKAGEDPLDTNPVNDNLLPSIEAGTSPKHTTNGAHIQALVPHALKGDKVAQADLLTAIYPLVIRHCRARLGYGNADDVAQEVCLAVLAALPTYSLEGKPFLAFVYGVAAHKVIDAYRAAARNRITPVAELPESPDTGLSPEESCVRGELSDDIFQLFTVLSPQQREILMMRIMMQYSAEETAAALGGKPGAIRTAQHRALTKLRGVFDGSMPQSSHALKALVTRIAEYR